MKPINHSSERGRRFASIRPPSSQKPKHHHDHRRQPIPNHRKTAVDAPPLHRRTCSRRWIKSPSIRRISWPITRRSLTRTAKLTNCRATCLSGRRAATRRSASAFSPASMATSRKARTRIVQFIKLLEAKPELAAGYYLSLYPVCNPTGFEDGTRFSRSGKDLNREFWKNSDQPEVRLLQAELDFAFVSGNHFAAHRRHERRLLRLRPRRDADEASHRTRVAGRRKTARAQRRPDH